MLIGKELPCILDDMLNEVNVSTINTMNKMTLTWVKRSKHPCFLLVFLFVLFSPRELLQCGTSSPCRGQISWFKQTVSSSVVSYPAKSHQWHCFFWVGSCGFSEEGPFLGRVLLWVPALCLAGQDPTRATCFLQFLSWSLLPSRWQDWSLSEDLCMPSGSAPLGKCCKGIVL